MTTLKQLLTEIAEIKPEVFTLLEFELKTLAENVRKAKAEIFGESATYSEVELASFAKLTDEEKRARDAAGKEATRKFATQQQSLFQNTPFVLNGESKHDIQPYLTSLLRYWQDLNDEAIRQKAAAKKSSGRESPVLELAALEDCLPIMVTDLSEGEPLDVTVLNKAQANIEKLRTLYTDPVMTDAEVAIVKNMAAVCMSIPTALLQYSRKDEEKVIKAAEAKSVAELKEIVRTCGEALESKDLPAEKTFISQLNTSLNKEEKGHIDAAYKIRNFLTNFRDQKKSFEKNEIFKSLISKYDELNAIKIAADEESIWVNSDVTAKGKLNEAVGVSQDECGKYKNRLIAEMDLLIGRNLFLNENYRKDKDGTDEFRETIRVRDPEGTCDALLAEVRKREKDRTPPIELSERLNDTLNKYEVIKKVEAALSNGTAEKPNTNSFAKMKRVAELLADQKNRDILGKNRDRLGNAFLKVMGKVLASVAVFLPAVVGSIFSKGRAWSYIYNSIWQSQSDKLAKKLEVRVRDANPQRPRGGRR